jgi:DNA-directed RNA polymerase subunit N (RpoN/RPB10)
MSCHIRCPDCGNDLAELFPAYEAVKMAYLEERQKKYGNIDLEKIDFCSEILPSFAFIFDALGVDLICCRMHMIGATDFDNV